MSQLDDVLVRQLHLTTGIPEEELRTLTAQQAENILAAIEAARRGLLAVPETIDCLKKNGLFDLPSRREEQHRYLDEVLDQEVRILADLYGFKLAKEEGAYPPTRFN
jgi:hypothetical protein